MIVKSEYFHGHKVSDYGIQNGYVDYATLAKCGDIVLCNDIEKLFYGTLNGEYVEPIVVNGYDEYDEYIAELQEEIEELLQREEDLETSIEGLENSSKIEEVELLICNLDDEICSIQAHIDDLEYEQNEKDIFQYFIISKSFAELLKEWTYEIIFYIEHLDLYIWGITHKGTPWENVLTDIELDSYDNSQ